MIGLDVGGMPTALTCSATSTGNNVTAVLNMFVSVVDTQAPSFVAGSGQQDDLPIEANVANGALVNYSEPFAVDAGDDAPVDPNVVVNCTPMSGSNFDYDPYLRPTPTPVSCTATDVSGNRVEQDFFVVRVNDTMDPIFDSLDLTLPVDQLPVDRTVDATDPQGAWVSFDQPTATDFMGVDTMVDVSCDVPGSGSWFPYDPSLQPTPKTVTCTAEDDSGNAVDYTFVVSVQDLTPPTLIPASTDPSLPPLPTNLAFEATGPGGAWVTFVEPTPDHFDDNVDTMVDVSCNPPGSGSWFGFTAPNSTPSNTTTVICTAVDDSGNSLIYDFDVTVQDNQAPMMSMPADVEADTTQVDGAFVTFSYPLATDSVDSSVGVSCAPASGSFFTYTAPNSTLSNVTSVVCTATDDSGNSSAAGFSVTVQDISGPAIDNEFPGNFVPDETSPFSLLPGENTFQLIWGPFGASDPDPNLEVWCTVNEGTVNEEVLTPIVGEPDYTFMYDFGIGENTIVCIARDSNLNESDPAVGTFVVVIEDHTAPVITLTGDAEVTVKQGSGPYVDAGATAEDNGSVDVSSSIVIDSSAVDTNTTGTYLVTITATDASGNTAEIARTVIVEFAYFGSTGIIPTKTNVKVGSSNPLIWAWLDENSDPVDSSGDVQLLSIRNCTNHDDILVDVAGDPGSSGFRFKTDWYWQFNWDSVGTKGQKYCAVVESSLTGQTQSSPPIGLR
jgi:hypothetical protein